MKNSSAGKISEKNWDMVLVKEKGYSRQLEDETSKFLSIYTSPYEISEKLGEVT